MISVIIPSARRHAVETALQAVMAQIVEVCDMEIILVTPHTHCREFQTGDSRARVRVVVTDALYPPGMMRNIGARQASGSFLAFLDDDCIPPKNWLAVLLDQFEAQKSVGAVGCRLSYGSTISWGRCADHCLFAAYQYRRGLFIEIGSAAIIVRREVFFAVGGFDTKLLASEDWDLSLKITASGWSCYFTPEVEVHHDHDRNSLLAILKQSFLSGCRSGLVVQKRHHRHLSWLARLSTRFDRWYLYWLLVLPYAGIVSLAQGMELLQREPKALLYLPVIIASRISYHIGVLSVLSTLERKIGSK